MTVETIKEMLGQLAEIRAALAAHDLAKQEAIDGVLTPEIRQQIADIETEFDGLTDSAKKAASELEAHLKAAVIEHGATVKAAGLQAVFSNGRTSWDTRALDGYAAAHPEVAQFKVVGSPSVSIRVTK